MSNALFSKAEELKIFDTNSICSTIIGGDFNVTLDQDLDGSGGINKCKEAVKFLEDICVDYDLLDIWRLRNPLVKRFTWRQKNPIIQRWLDFWLVSNDLQEDIESVDILPSIKSDHSAIVLSINGIDENNRGPNFWKFNSSLVNDKNYCELINSEYKEWRNEFKEVEDDRVLWDIVKYKIRQVTIHYSKTKARERKANLHKVEENLKICAERCDAEPNAKNIEELECLQTENDLLYDYITQSSIIQARTTWYEKGEKSNKYFLNLEKSNKKRGCVRKILTRTEVLTTNPKKIMNELVFLFRPL